MNRRLFQDPCWLAAVGVFLLAAAASLGPGWHKGHGPRPAHDNLLVARTLALTGVAAAEDGEGSFVSSGRARALADSGSLPSTGIGNRLTYGLYGWGMKHVPALLARPELLSALLAGLAAGMVALTARRYGRRSPWLAGVFYVSLPVVGISSSSPAHLDLAVALSAGAWMLVLGGGRRPRWPILVAAGVLAGGAALARDSFVVLAGLLAITALGSPADGSVADERAAPPRLRARLLLAAIVPIVAAIVFLLGGGLDSVYLDSSLRGQEMSRLGHAFPDYATFERYRSLEPAERRADPLLATLDQRLASIYAGEGDPAPGGAVGRLAARARVALGFYPRAALAFDGFGGPLVLFLVVLGLLGGVRPAGRWRLAQLGRPLRLALLVGPIAFLAFHSCIGTSNESHLAVFAAPLALALALGVQEGSAVVARAWGERPGETVVLGILALTLLLHQGMASRVAMSRLYNGAGAARYGSADAHDLALRVAAATAQTPAGTILVGSRGEDALAIAWVADRSTLILSPATLEFLAQEGRLEEYLLAHDVAALAGYPEELLEQAEVSAALRDRIVLGRAAW